MTKASQFILLVEDAVHQSFARRYLNCLGYQKHQLVLEKLSAGKGSGEQRVRRQYPRVVKQYRNRQVGKRAETGLLVVVDADRKSVEEHQRELREALVADRVEQRTENERIAHWIPKWSIETWIECLNSGKPVAEDMTRKGAVDVDGESVRRSAESFFEFTRPNTPVPAHWTPSLVAGADESKRL